MAELRRRRLGRTGLSVAELGLGAMDTPHSDEAAETLTTALDLGINVVDTAREYEGSEFLIGQVVRAHGGADFHIASKTFSHGLDGSQPRGGAVQYDGNRRCVRVLPLLLCGSGWHGGRLRGARGAISDRAWQRGGS